MYAYMVCNYTDIKVQPADSAFVVCVYIVSALASKFLLIFLMIINTPQIFFLFFLMKEINLIVGRKFKTRVRINYLKNSTSLTVLLNIAFQGTSSKRNRPTVTYRLQSKDITQALMVA